jgi:hypothetical protein
MHGIRYLSPAMIVSYIGTSSNCSKNETLFQSEDNDAWFATFSSSKLSYQGSPLFVCTDLFRQSFPGWVTRLHAFACGCSLKCQRPCNPYRTIRIGPWLLCVLAPLPLHMHTPCMCSQEPAWDMHTPNQSHRNPEPRNTEK